MIPLGIANSSSFIALGQIERLDILRSNFNRVVVPPAVTREVRDLPGWVEVETPTWDFSQDLFPPRIHAGETDVILLGLQNPGAVLVLDDKCARTFARDRGMSVVGTLGLILRCKRHGHVPEVRPILELLEKTGFRIAPALHSEVLRLAGE